MWVCVSGVGMLERPHVVNVQRKKTKFALQKNLEKRCSPGYSDDNSEVEKPQMLR